MSTDDYHIEKYSFRVIGATNNLIDLLYNAYGRSQIKVQEYFKDKDVLVLTIELLENVDYSNLIDIMENLNFDRKKCGIYISLVTNRDNDGIGVPDFVIAIYKKIAYNIDFSFVTI